MEHSPSLATRLAASTLPTVIRALYSNTSGAQNTATGISALQSNTSGSSNTANGAYALVNNTTGSDNTANGMFALFSNTIGNSNTASGSQALLSNTSGDFNTASGFEALYNNTTGDRHGRRLCSPRGQHNGCAEHGHRRLLRSGTTSIGRLQHGRMVMEHSTNNTDSVQHGLPALNALLQQHHRRRQHCHRLSRASITTLPVALNTANRCRSTRFQRHQGALQHGLRYGRASWQHRHRKPSP